MKTIECVLPDKRYQQVEFTDVVARVSPDKNIHECRNDKLRHREQITNTG